jgi:uncharacterized membrane protein YciS (DUF1049 family)
LCFFNMSFVYILGFEEFRFSSIFSLMLSFLFLIQWFIKSKKVFKMREKKLNEWLKLQQHDKHEKKIGGDPNSILSIHFTHSNKFAYNFFLIHQSHFYIYCILPQYQNLQLNCNHMISITKLY